MSLGCCMLCFLFYFASASQHSLVCLMSHCQVHAVAWQQEGSPCVIHRAAASSFANCAHLPGKGFSQPCLRQLRGLLPRKGKKTRESLAELWGVFGGPSERKYPEGLGNTWTKTEDFPLGHLSQSHLEWQSTSVQAHRLAFWGR